MKKRPFLFYLAAGFLIFLGFAALLADVLAPYGATEETRAHSFHPPVKVYFSDAGSLSRPFVYVSRPEFDESLRKIYKEDRTRKYFLEFGDGKLFGVPEPAKVYLLGTDSRGRDLFSRILFGARISLSIGLLGALIAAFIGLLVGAAAGYFGGIPDLILMRLAEFFIMIPGFYFLLALRSVLPPGLESSKVYLLVVVILSLIGWGGIARVIRGMVLSIRQQDFVEASKVLGRHDWKVLIEHVVPHTFSYLTVILSASVPGYILGESALSILGLGIQDPAVSWGNLLTEAVSIPYLTIHPWILFPGFFIVVTSFAFYALADNQKETVTHEFA